MEVNCESLAVIGATLANGGVCPITLDRVIKPDAVRDVLSLLHSCGFYEYSGQFAFKVRIQETKCPDHTVVDQIKLHNKNVVLRKQH